MSSDSTNDDVDEIAESNILAVPRSHSSFLVLIMVFRLFLLSYLLVNHLSFLS